MNYVDPFKKKYISLSARYNNISTAAGIELIFEKGNSIDWS